MTTKNGKKAKKTIFVQYTIHKITF